MILEMLVFWICIAAIPAYYLAPRDLGAVRRWVTFALLWVVFFCLIILMWALWRL